MYAARHGTSCNRTIAEAITQEAFVTSLEHAGAGGGSGGGEQACRGTLAQVNALGGPPRPLELCSANAWASDCATLPSAITRSYATECADIQRIALE